MTRLLCYIFFMFLIHLPMNGSEEDVALLIAASEKGSINASQEAKELVKALTDESKKPKMKITKVLTNQSDKVCQFRKTNPKLIKRCGMALKAVDASENMKANAKVQIFIFVSSAMPSESIKILGQEAHKIGAKIIFRGLIGGTFKETQNFIQDLEIIAEIDPTKFEDYQVSQVPTFVLVHNNIIDRVAGHISIWEALDQFRTRGELKDKAQKLYMLLTQSVSRGARS